MKNERKDAKARKRKREMAEVCLKSVRRVLSNSCGLDEFRDKENWPFEADDDHLLWRLMHEAEHFLIDESVRARDLAYEKYQRNLIESLMEDVNKEFGLPS